MHTEDFARSGAITRVVRKLIAAGLVALLVMGAAHAQEKVLTVGNTLAPVSLDPARSSPGTPGIFLQPAYDPLVRTAADGALMPALAIAWEVASDGKSVTFTLRDDAKFSDGEPVTAEAAKRSIEYWVGRNGPLATNLKTLQSIEVLDRYRFRVNVSVSNPSLASQFNAYYLSGNLISPKGLDNPDALMNQTFGAGPYMLDLERTVSGRTYSYIPNPHYYDKSRIHWDRLTISVFEDQNSAIQAMEVGQLKLLLSDAVTGHTNSTKLPRNIRIVSTPYNCACLILYDRAGKINPALADIRVRKALNLALNRPLIAESLFGKLGDPTAQIQARGFPGYDETNEKIYPFDVDKAKALLAEAGYPNGFTLKMGYFKSTLTDLVAQVLIDQFAAIGLTVEPREYHNLAATHQGVFKDKEVDSLLSIPGSGPPSLTKAQWFVPGGLHNPYGSEDAELTALVETASGLPVEEAEEAWKAVYTRLVDLAWFVPAAAVHMTYFASDDIVTPEFGGPSGMHLIDVEPVQ